MKLNFLNRILASALSLALLSPQALADSKISDMTNGGTVQTTDQIAAVRSGSNVRVQVGSAATQPSSAFLSSTGTIPAASLPAPTVSSLGGVQASSAGSNQFLTGISTLGVPTKAQPAFTDLSGNIAVSQMNGGTGASSTTFWRGDGTWGTPAGGGGTPGGTSGQIQFNNGGAFGGFTLGGDCSVATSTGSLTCTKTGGVSFAPSATTDTTNAANISSGNLSVNRFNSGTGASSSTFLRGDGTWATPAGGGGSVSVTAATPNVVVSPTPGTGTFTIGLTELLNAQTGTSYTVLSSDIGKTLTHTNSSSVAVTLPSAATTGFGAGASYTEVSLGNGTTTITPASGTINGASSLILHKGGFAYPISDGTNYTAITFPGFGTITSGSLMKYLDASGAPTAAVAGTDFQGPINLTTTGTSGAATLIGNTLNIPQYSGGGGGVSSLNSLTGALSIAAGSNITVTPSGSTITISGSSSATTNLGTSVTTASPQVSGDSTTGLYTAGTGKVDVAISGNKVAEWDANGVTVTGTSTATIFNTTGAYNIGGANAVSFPAADSTAGGSVAIGNAAMGGFSSSAAYKNTAIGYNSMSGTTPTTAAINNTAVGANTMKGNSFSGNANTTIGYNSCAALTSGTNNFCGGVFAGSGLTSGQSNVLVGVSAGSNITTGNFNTILNGAAYTSNQTNAVALGAATKVGTNDTAIGYGALGGTLSDGNGNTALGSNAGAAITTAKRNVFLGGGAGSSVTATATNNVFLGYQVASGTASQGTNNIVIGTSSADSLPSTTTSNYVNLGNWLLGDRSKGIMGVEGPIPALSSCGTSPTIATGSNNTIGSFTVGTSAGSGCVLTFASSGFASAPFCTVTARSAAASFAYAPTATTLTLTSTTISSVTFDYHCEVGSNSTNPAM